MAISGKSGKFKIGAVVVSDIKSWDLDLDVDIKDVTDFDSNGWAEKIACIKSWSGSCEGSWNVATDTTGQKAIQDAWFAGTTLSGEFNINGTNKFTGTTIVKKLKVSDPVDDIVKFSVDLEGTGALAYA